MPGAVDTTLGHTCLNVRMSGGVNAVGFSIVKKTSVLFPVLIAVWWRLQPLRLAGCCRYRSTDSCGSLDMREPEAVPGRSEHHDNYLRGCSRIAIERNLYVRFNCG